MGDAVKTYFTPEEKSAFVRFLEQQKSAGGLDELRAILLPVAEHAALAELQANWLYESMMAKPGAEPGASDERRLIELQGRRLKYSDLGRQIEAYWNVYPENPSKAQIFEQMIAAYHSAGDSAAELRLLSAAYARAPLGGNLQRRYFELLLANAPDRLVDLAGSAVIPEARFAAANFAVANGGSAVALRAVESGGRRLPPVWARAYTGLVGLYYGEADARVNTSFSQALGSMKIGDRLAAKGDRNQQLTGDTWFYYGSRYGEYLDVTKRPGGEDFHPAEVEGHPARASAYFTLAEYYRERAEPQRAISDYEHTLELNPLRADAHSRIAEIFWQQGKKDQAVAQWKRALEVFGRQQDSGRVPEEFWDSLAATLKEIGQRKALDAVRPEADRVLRTYIRRNGQYRAQPLLEAAVAASSDPSAGVAWVLDLSRAASDPATFLAQLVGEQWFPEAHKAALFDRIVADAENRASQAYGQAREAMLGELRNWEFRRLDYLLSRGLTEKARAAFDALPDEVRRANGSMVAPLEIRLAAQEGKLDSLLERYRREPDKAPPPEVLQNAASSLREKGNKVASQKLLEFFYTRQLEQRNLEASNFLGLAEIRLETGDTAGASRLLRRMTLVAGEPFETQMAAADLLQKYSRHAEAAEFVAERVQAVPWDADARIRLARAQIAAGKDRAAAVAALHAVAASKDAAYASRSDAALLLGQNKAAAPLAGSAELDLLVKNAAPAPTAAEQPFFYRARVEATRGTADPAARVQLLLGAIALNPDAPPEARVWLEHAAVETSHYPLAVAAIRPTLEAGGLRYVLQRAESGEGEEEQPRRARRRAVFAEAGSPERDYFAQQFLSGTSLSDAERSSAARDLAAALEKLGQLGTAETFLRVAYALQPDEKARAGLRQSLDRLEANATRRAENARRRPVLSQNLEQPNVVRPRLGSQARPTSNVRGPTSRLVSGVERWTLGVGRPANGGVQ